MGLNVYPDEVDEADLGYEDESGRGTTLPSAAVSTLSAIQDKSNLAGVRERKKSDSLPGDGEDGGDEDFDSDAHRQSLDLLNFEDLESLRQRNSLRSEDLEGMAEQALSLIEEENLQNSAMATDLVNEIIDKVFD